MLRTLEVGGAASKLRVDQDAVLGFFVVCVRGEWGSVRGQRGA